MVAERWPASFGVKATSTVQPAAISQHRVAALRLGRPGSPSGWRPWTATVGDPRRHEADVGDRERVGVADLADLQRVEVEIARPVGCQRRQAACTGDLRLHGECAEAGFGDLDRSAERTLGTRGEDHSDAARPARRDGVALDASPKVMPNWGLVDCTLSGTNEPGPALYSRTNHSAPGRPTMPVPTLMSAIDSCGCWVMPTTWRVEFGRRYGERAVRRAGQRVEHDDASGRRQLGVGVRCRRRA